ncbi:MAG: efflux RND transporter permease subunit, partial [Halioglobus sp.]|nr:efflux RND transporter permease subunit [Halioglobus sp.]
MFESLVRRPILVTVSVLIVCILGIAAALRIPVQMIPDLDVRVIGIRTTWPGATPLDVEREIVIEQEEYLRSLPNLTRMVSTASASGAEVELEFPLGTDVTEMMIRVNNALTQVPSYPETVDEPRIFANAFSSNPFMFFSITPLPGNPRHVDIELAQDFVEDTVRTRLSRVPGISEVFIAGGVERQVQVLVDPARLASRGLSLVDVREALRNRNRDRSGGTVDAGKRQYLLRTVGRFDSVEALSQLVLARRGDTIIRLADVASVTLDHFEENSYTTFNGQQNLFLMLRKEPGSNVIESKQQVQLEIAAVNSDVLNPAGMEILPIADDVVYVEESVRNVWQNLLLGALLATGVMFLFLRSARVTLAGVIGIPICVIIAFLGLLIAGRTVNVISLAGIAFAIGMTLDNSIVVLESIALARSKGIERLRAAAEGVREVWPAVFASTMTTVLVFVPVAFVEQEAGQLYSDVAMAISAAILASMLVAITVLPTAMARIPSPPAPAESRARRGQLPVGERLRQRTLAGVTSVLSSTRRRWLCIVLATLSSAAVIVFLTPPAEYLPEGEEAKVFAIMNAPPGYNLTAMREIASDIERALMPYVQADRDAFERGETDMPPIAYFNMRVSAEQLRIISEPREARDVEALMDALSERYRQYPGMRAFATRGSIISSNQGGTRSINIDISGPALADIYRVAQAAYARADEIFDNPRIQSQPSSLSLAQPLLQVRPNWERAAELGLSGDDLGFIVAAMTDGSYVDEFFLEDDKIDIYLYSDAGRNIDLDALAQLPLYTAGGGVLPLSAVADIRESVDTSSVRRVDGRRTVTLSIIPPRSVALETGVARVKQDLVQHLRDSGEIPATIDLVISGAADQLDATREALLGNYIVALMIIYLLMVAIFSHWGYPLLIMTAIPLGVAGGLVGLAVLNAAGGMLPLLGMQAVLQPFDMISMLGFLILMGTVVNNPILVVHRAVDNVKTRAMPPLQAVSEAVEVRLRPIAMSTITTLFGLAPLVLIPGAGTELYRGVGVIVMFGILGSALVTLTMLP